MQTDTHRNGRRYGTSGTFRTAINLTKCFVGAASFELPWAFASGGAVGSTAGVIVLALLSLFSLSRLSQCAELAMKSDGACKSVTYPEIGRAAFGKVGYGMAWFGVIAMSLGVCGSYIVFITTTLCELTSWPRVIESGNTASSEDAAQWVFVILPLIIVLSWLRSVSSLAWTSSVGIAALVFAVAVSTYDATENGESIQIDWTINSTPKSGEIGALRLSTYPLFLGNAGYLYLISTAILPITSSMEHPRRFGRALFPSIAFVTVVNIFFGLYAAMRYGGVVCDADDKRIGSGLSCVKDNVLKNMNTDLTSTKLVKWLLVIDLLFTTIVFLFPINEAIESAIFSPEADDANMKLSSCQVDVEEGSDRYRRLRDRLTDDDTEHGRQRRDSWTTVLLSPRTWKVNVSRSIVAIAVAAVALGVPFFSLLTGLTGGFGNNILGFILPPLFYYKLRSPAYWREGTTRRKLEFAGLLVTFIFGCAFLVLTLVFFSREIAKQERS